MLALQRREAMITLVAFAAFIGGAAAYVEPRVALFLYAGVPIARLLYRAWLQRLRTATLAW